MNTSNMLKVMLLMGALTALLVLLGGLIGGTYGIVFALGFSVLLNFGAYWFSDSIALRMSGAKPAPEAEYYGLHEIVSRLAMQANLPKPKVYVIESDVPNAFATGRSPKHAAIAVTTGLMRGLALDEAEGVIAHELSHIKHRDTLIATIATTIAGAVTSIASMMRWALIFGGSGRRRRDQGGAEILVALVMMIVAPIAAVMIQLAISRNREFAADAEAANLTGRPRSLANALLKLDDMAGRTQPLSTNPSTASLFIVNPLRGGSTAATFARLFSTHPPIAERVARLEDMAGRA
jgi:heat shock protein HtpX